MRGNTIGIQLEPEELELLARIERETGKSIHQLTGEAVRNTYSTKYDCDRARNIELLEAVDKISKQVRQVMASVEKQRHEIDLFSNSSKQDSRQSYPPPPHSIYT